MSMDDKAAVAAAVEANKKSRNSRGNGKSNGKATEVANEAAQSIQGKLDKAQRQVADSAKGYILEGINIAIQEICEGNLGLTGEEAISALDRFIGVFEERQGVLESNYTAPKSLPPSSYDVTVTS